MVEKSACSPRLSGYRLAQTSAAIASNDAEISLPFLTTGLFDDQKRADLTPAAIVEWLDRYIVGQTAAKRAVANALRNRWRRLRIEPPMKDEIMPKNILMIGPTGSGKTEIARRLSKLADAPFVKVEATRYTELGYVGRDVDEIIKDLLENALQLVRQRVKERVAQQAAKESEIIIIESLVGNHASPETEASFRSLYRAGELDDRQVDIELPQENPKTGFEQQIYVLEKVFPDKAFGAKRPKDKKRMKVSEARAKLEELEAEKYLQSDLVVKEAIRVCEQDGIVFIDEIDKIVEDSSTVGWSQVSSVGVQRDLLPIIEGSVVQTKFGNVNTDHILFVCSGAFHSSKPSDMLAELQGRLPIRVELKGLSADDFYRILTEPENNMLRQQQVLLATENVDLTFTIPAVKSIARMAEDANRLLDNIGARRLHTILERVLSDISYTAPEKSEEARQSGQDSYKLVIDEPDVVQAMGDLLHKKDLSRYIL